MKTVTKEELRIWQKLDAEAKKSYYNLQHGLELWQARLGLSDWDIRVTWSKDHDLIQSGAKADVNYTLYSKQAVIRIIDPAMYDGHGFWEQDPESSLIHELLHVLLSPMRNMYFERKHSDDDIPEEHIVIQLLKFINSMRDINNELQIDNNMLKLSVSSLENQLGIHRAV